MVCPRWHPGQLQADALVSSGPGICRALLVCSGPRVCMILGSSVGPRSCWAPQVLFLPCIGRRFLHCSRRLFAALALHCPIVSAWDVSVGILPAVNAHRIPTRSVARVEDVPRAVILFVVSSFRVGVLSSVFCFLYSRLVD